MIISHKYKFIFIKTMKTAGTSIEVFLSQFCGESDVVTPIYPRVDPHAARNYQGIWNPLPEIIEKRGRGVPALMRNLFARNKFYNHIPARLVRNRLPRKVWNSYFKFSVERNPWDKTLSHFHMLNDRAGRGMTLDQYLDRQKFCLNYPIYTDAKGQLIVDKVIKYESLVDELYQVFDKLKIPFDGTLGVRAKSEHREDRRPYQQIFTSAQRELIEEVFTDEIKMHSYVY